MTMHKDTYIKFILIYFRAVTFVSAQQVQLEDTISNSATQNGTTLQPAFPQWDRVSVLAQRIERIGWVRKMGKL